MAFTNNRRARICLHFDINKTIIMTDVVSGRTLDETLSSLLSECTWGTTESKVIELRSAADWAVCHPFPENEPPIEGSITLGTYLEDFTLVPKKEQNRIKRAFTQEGNLGHQFLPHQVKLVEALRLDKNALKQELQYLASGYYHIIPSFFRLVEYLAENNVEFNILFRTFGVDIENVCNEFNLFCSGYHPAFVPSIKLDGTDPNYQKDLRITLPFYHGKLTHIGAAADDIHMTYTDFNKKETVQVSGADAVYKVIMQDWFNVDCSSSKQVDTCSVGMIHLLPGPSSNALIVMEAKGVNNADTVRHTHCAAIQDDFDWWHRNNESEHSGKLMLVDTSLRRLDADSTAEQVIQVFFDDNIERGRAHIVDVRDASSYCPVPFEVSQGRYLRRVDPYQAILDRDYYVKEIQRVIDLYA